MNETMENSGASRGNPEDTIKILIATDNHLGYQECDPIIGDDSFVAFEEILDLAVKNKVDMILLGGDLFHDNNPSQQTMNRCMALLRKYTMGSQPVHLQLLCSAPITRCEGSAAVNYLDQNLNISIPVFSIHGNHDDPSGVGLCSAMDTLSSAGLVNYFGKWTDLSNIEIRPILLQKGETLLALYGLSHIKDDRLCRLFLEEKVTMVRPKDTPGDWFNIFVLHQNRVDRGPKRFISDSYLPGFLDFVIWGHEHDCNIVPEKNLDKGFYVTQPGSSVPTSLAEGETIPKHVGLLEVKKRKFRFTPLKLTTVRPFVFDHMVLMDVPTTSSKREVKSEQIRDACKIKVQQMIREAKKLLTGHPKQPKIPLIRLRCEYTDDTQLFNLVKFGQIFYQQVANPDSDIIRLKKICQHRDRRDEAEARADIENLRELQQEETFSACVELFVEEYFAEHAETKLTVLSVKGMASGVERFLEKGDSRAIEKICKHQREATFKKMMELDVDEDNAKEKLEFLRDQRLNNVQDEEDLQEIFLKQPEGNGHELNEPNDSAPEDDDDQSVVEEMVKTPARKTTIPAMFKDLRSNDDDEEESPAPRSRGRPRGRGRGAPRGRGKKAPVTPNKPPLFPPTRPTRSSQKPNTSAIQFEEDSD